MTNLQFLAHVELKDAGDDFLINDLRSYQLEMLNHTLSTVIKNSAFYKKHLQGLSLPLTNIDDLAKLPFTTGQDLLENELEDFLCIGEDKAEEMIKQETSGITGTPKLIAFSQKDIYSTIHFFDFALQDLVESEKKIIICMLGNEESSLAHTLAKAADRFDSEGIIYGNINSFEDAATFIEKNQPHCLVGLPVQIFGLAVHMEHTGQAKNCYLESILVSGDYLAQTVRKKIESVFNCKVINHYSITEAGYGTALECTAQNGMHLREADIFLEIVNPDTGQNVTGSSTGELVITTLTREGMPLIRYRTGDFTSWINTPCPCGSILPKISCPIGKTRHLAGFTDHIPGIDIPDETIFQIPGVIDYELSIKIEKNKNIYKIDLKLWIIDEIIKDKNALCDNVRQLPELQKISCPISVAIADIDEKSPARCGKKHLIIYKD